VGLRILDIEAHGVSSLLYQSSIFPLSIPRLPIRRKGQWLSDDLVG
jgi:hypothetical protein